MKKLMIRSLLVAFVATALFADLRPREAGTSNESRLSRYELTLSAPKAEAGRVFRAIGRAVRGVVRKVGRAIGGVVRRVGRAIGKVGKAIGRAASRVGRAIGKVARTVGKGIVKGVKAIGKGVAQVAKGVVKVAKGVGKIAKSVVKGAVKFGGGLLKGLGRVVKGDFKGAANAVKAGARSAGRTIATGFKSGVKQIVSGVKDVASGVGKIAVGALQVALPFVDAEKVLKKIKEIIVGLLKKIAKGVLDSGLGKIFTKIIGMISPEIKDAIETIKRLVAAGQKIVDIIKNPDKYLQQGRQWAIDALTDLAMKLFEPPLQKLVGALTGLGIKLLKHLVTTPLTAAISSALASFTFGIGAVLAPLIKLALDKFLDWAIDKVKMLLAKAVMGIAFVKKFLKTKIIAPIINKIYDSIVKLIRKKVPGLAGKLTTSKENRAGVRAKPTF